MFLDYISVKGQLKILKVRASPKVLKYKIEYLIILIIEFYRRKERLDIDILRYII